MINANDNICNICVMCMSSSMAYMFSSIHADPLQAITETNTKPPILVMKTTHPVCAARKRNAQNNSEGELVPVCHFHRQNYNSILDLL